MKKVIHNILLNESAGVSFEVREWSDIIYNEIVTTDNRVRIIIDGYDHYDTYEKFGIDYVVIDFYDGITGYDPKKSGYDKDGYYVVLLYIQPQLVNGQANYDLKSALNHELKHAYQDFKRQSKGHSNIDNTKESKEFYTDDFVGLLNSRGSQGPIKTILMYYYYLSNLERDAYLENVYDENPEYEKTIREILNTNFDDFKSGPKSTLLSSNWEYITKLDIPLVKKFNSPEEFIDYSENRLKREAEKVIKKINKLKYVHGLNESELDWANNAPDWRVEFINFMDVIVKNLNYVTKRVWDDEQGLKNFNYTITTLVKFSSFSSDSEREYPLQYYDTLVKPFNDLVGDIRKLGMSKEIYATSMGYDKPKFKKKRKYTFKPIEETHYMEFMTHRRLLLNLVDSTKYKLADIPEPKFKSKVKNILRHFK